MPKDYPSLISLFCKKWWRRGVKNFKKLMTSFMNGPLWIKQPNNLYNMVLIHSSRALGGGDCAQSSAFFWAPHMWHIIHWHYHLIQILAVTKKWRQYWFHFYSSVLCHVLLLTLPLYHPYRVTTLKPDTERKNSECEFLKKL